MEDCITYMFQFLPEYSINYLLVNKLFYKAYKRAIAIYPIEIIVNNGKLNAAKLSNIHKLTINIECEIEEINKIRGVKILKLLYNIKGNIAFVTSLQRLTKLVIWNCENINGNIGELQFCHLTKLEIRDCPNINGNIEELQFRRLTTLVIWDCSKIYGNIEKLNLFNLTNLDISFCHNINGNIENLQLPKLKNLVIVYCSNINGNIEKLQNVCINLTKLKIRYCSKIYGNIEKLQLPKLSELEIGNCKYINCNIDNALNFPNLTTVSIERSGNITGKYTCNYLN